MKKDRELKCSIIKCKNANFFPSLIPYTHSLIRSLRSCQSLLNLSPCQLLELTLPFAMFLPPGMLTISITTIDPTLTTLHLLYFYPPLLFSSCLLLWELIIYWILSMPSP